MADREKLIDFIVEAMPPCYSDVFACRIADRLISKGVTVRERGRWTLQRYYGGLRKGMVARIICSECGYPNEKTNFCPNCGADMRGEEDGT